MAVTSTASTKENVVIAARDCSATILPACGAKIASLQFRGHELLQPPLAPIAPRTPTMPFDASDASGWDECLPSVAECDIHTGAGPTHIPDHGDLWRVEWKVLASETSSITLAGSCFSLPLTLERTLALTETQTGVRFSLNYKLTNAGAHKVPWSWAAHPLFTVALGDRIVLPDSIHTLRLEGSGANRLGSSGDEKQWPIAELANGSHTDLSWVQDPASGIGDKLFAGPLSAHDAWCTLERPSAGLRIRVTFDSDATPYLGLWICYGGWPDRPGPKQICVAPEPSTAPVDSLAIQGPWSRTLGPGESTTWPMHVNIDPL